VSTKEKFRESLRLPTYLKAFYYLDGEKEGFDMCNVLNISYGGICIKLYSHDKIKIGARINFGLIYKWKPISVKGALKWTRNVGKCYVGGIELTKALDVFTVIKCYNGGTSKKEQEDHCNYFIRAFCKIKKCFSKNKRNIKEVSHEEKVTCLINDFKIRALGKIEYIEDQLYCISKDSDKIAKGLNDVNLKLIRRKNAEENLKKKSCGMRNILK
jgi:hypothetical protein